MTIFYSSFLTLKNFRDQFQYSEPTFCCIETGYFEITVFWLSSSTQGSLLKAKLGKVASTRNTFYQAIRIEILQNFCSRLCFFSLSQFPNLLVTVFRWNYDARYIYVHFKIRWRIRPSHRILISQGSSLQIHALYSRKVRSQLSSIAMHLNLFNWDRLVKESLINRFALPWSSTYFSTRLSLDDTVFWQVVKDLSFNCKTHYTSYLTQTAV